MPLDIGKRERSLALLDAYSALLTEHQRTTLELHLGKDWSYAEVAAAQGVSRAAVHDLVRRTEQVLEEYEAKLGLVAAGARREVERGRLEARLQELQTELKRLRQAVKVSY